MFASNLNVSEKSKPNFHNDALVNDMIDSLGPEFKGEQTNDSKDSKLQKMTSAENLRMNFQKLNKPKSKTGVNLQFDTMIDSPTVNRTREPKKPLVLAKSENKHKGTLKHFDNVKSFGFIYFEKENREIFFHANDIQDPRLTLDLILKCKKGIFINVEFKIMEYIGKNNKSEKAIEICLDEN